MREVWINGPGAPTHYVDVTETFPRKIAALQAHARQVGGRDNLADLLRQRLAKAAEQGGLPDGHLAEVFRVIDTG